MTARGNRACATMRLVDLLVTVSLFVAQTALFIIPLSGIYVLIRPCPWHQAVPMLVVIALTAIAWKVHATTWSAALELRDAGRAVPPSLSALSDQAAALCAAGTVALCIAALCARRRRRRPSELDGPADQGVAGAADPEAVVA